MAKSKKQFKKKCEVCHKSFTAQRSTAKYCPSCRVKGNNKKRRENQKVQKAEETRIKADKEKYLDKTLSDLRKYNKKNGTNLSYGKFVAMKNAKKANKKCFQK